MTAAPGTAAALLVLMLTGLLPALAATLRGSPLARLVSLQLLGLLATLASLLAAQVAGRTAYLDVALLMAVLSFAGTLVYARFAGRIL